MDVEQLAGLYQRRYNIMSELNKETDEVLLAAESEDNVSMDLLLDLRQESLGRLEGWRRKVLRMRSSFVCLPGEKVTRRLLPTSGRRK